MVEAIQTNTVNMLGANGHPILSLVKKKFKMKVKTSIKIYIEKTASFAISDSRETESYTLWT